jgi:hypothetical protein
MPAILAIIGLGLLLWAPPAAAQKVDAKNVGMSNVHPLTVSIHENLPPLVPETVKNILNDASEKLLQRENNCNVRFKLNGPITRLARGTPLDILNKDHLEAVHREAADLKIVRSIKFCMGRFDKEGFIGCAWRPESRRPKTMIIARRRGLLALRHIVLAHEFGHTTGLQHRADPQALMTPCKLSFHRVKITPNECQCFVKGRGGCDHIPEPDPPIECPEKLQR